jgi:uncharacterized membrane protein YfcA
MDYLFLALTGILVGVVSGTFGIGGGIIAVPLLVYFFHFSQHSAQGTSLAMLLPPVGILAVYRYWQAGHVQVVPALILSGAFLLGGLVGANLAISLSALTMQRVFGVFISVVGIWMVVKTYLG